MNYFSKMVNFNRLDLRYFSITILASILWMSNVAFSQTTLKIMNYNRTQAEPDYWHVSVPHGNAMLDSLGVENNWTVTNTADPTLFNDDTLATYDVLVFHNAKAAGTDGSMNNALTIDQRNALIKHIQSGKGIVSLHSGTFLYKDWDWWVNLMGGLRHTGGYGRRLCDITRVDKVHISMKNIPDLYQMEIEWYHFDGPSFNPEVHILATAEMPDSIRAIDPPIAEPIQGPTEWCQHYDGGRMYATQNGHFIENYYNPHFARSMYGAILWAADKNAGGCGRPDVSIRFDMSNYVVNKFGQGIPSEKFNLLGRKLKSKKGKKIHFNILTRNPDAKKNKNQLQP